MKAKIPIKYYEIMLANPEIVCLLVKVGEKPTQDYRVDLNAEITRYYHFEQQGKDIEGLEPAPKESGYDYYQTDRTRRIGWMALWLEA